MTAEGSLYKRKDGRWCGQYRDARGKVRYLYRKTKNEAKKALREALQDRDDNIVPADKLTVSLYLDEWMDERKNTIGRRTWRVQESLVRNRIKPYIGDQRISKLTAKDVREMYRHLTRGGLSASTVGTVHALIKQAMRDAVREKRLRSNPLDDVKPPKQIQNHKDVLTAAQVNRLLDAVKGDRFECAFVVAATCALRIGEVLALRYEDFDLERGTLRIERTLYYGECSQPKTPSSRRTLTLPKRTLEALTRLCKLNREQRGYLFATSGGKPVDAANFYKWTWKPALRRAGLPETLTPHQLRHGAASLLLNQNVPVPVVSRYLGHANPGITMKVYAHAIDGTGGMAADGIDAALG